MYVTTSRKPSLSTKILAYNIANFLNSKYEHRGKKSIEDVIARAEELGYDRIIVVSEQKGNPYKLAFIDAKTMMWIFPFIIFSTNTSNLKRLGKIGKEVEKVVSGGERARVISSLFDTPEPATDDTTKLIISDDYILFKYKDKALRLKVRNLLEARKESGEND
ncbi:MAG: hypothetical protein NZ903_00535 [Candidatus Micrarchaeota archaeon]|nr:hypothetical protein [Candidatus Micrarchaeota archaeon]